MTVTIRETIALALVDVLGTVPGIDAGNVFRDDTAGLDVFPRLELLDDIDDPIDQQSFGVDICRVHFRIVGVVQGAGRSDVDLRAMAAALDVIRGETIKRVMADTQRAGAFDTAIGDAAYDHGDDPSAKPTKGFGLALSIDYHTKAGDPFTPAY